MTEPTPEPVDQPEGAESEPDTFPRTYVEKLRAENAELRVKGKTLDTIRDALRQAVLEKGSAGVLHDPIEWADEFDGEDGLPDVEKIKAAAEALAEEKPHLARVRGDAGQGFRGEQSDTFDLADLLRSGA